MLEVLVDSAYGSGAMPAAPAPAGLAAVIKPWPLKSVIEGGFTTADFTVAGPGPGRRSAR